MKLPTRFGEEPKKILYRRHVNTWKSEEINEYKYKEESSPLSLLTRGDYVCMFMNHPETTGTDHIECINPETKKLKTITDDDKLGWPIHNGEHVAYIYMIPSPPFGSGMHIKVRNIADGGVVKLWDYLGDKSEEYMSPTGLVWTDLRNDTLGNKNGNASRQNSDIYYLDLDNMEEKAICTNSAIQFWPATDGNLVAWMDKRHCPDPNAAASQDEEEIYIYDMENDIETRLTEGGGGWKDRVRISGKWLTFIMPSDPGINIFTVDLEARGLYSE